MIQSVLAMRSRSVSKPPVVTSLYASGVNCGSGLSLRAFEALPRQIGGHVEKQCRHAGVGAVQRDLRAHGPRTEDRDRVDRDHRFTP
jgi:hypothetical protein